jgi:dTDP-4-dehydrorhamnose reductase
MINILVTGANGQLGNELKSISGDIKGKRFHFTDIDELDITRIVNIEDFISRNNINYIINCAAYNAVDKAEKDEETAFLINSLAVKYLAQIARKNNIFMIHVSTDFVFDGLKNTPYIESDLPGPVSVYAKSKYEGELNVLNTLEKGIIIRTSWLYSSFGNNFLKTIMKNARIKDQLNVVNDQVGTPTWAKDLALVILELVNNSGLIKDVEIFHYSNEGTASWYDFAEAIVEKAGIECQVNPIETKDYPLPAHRPFYSVLNKSKIKSFLDIDIPYWQDSLEDCLDQIKNKA